MDFNLKTLTTISEALDVPYKTVKDILIIHRLEYFIKHATTIKIRALKRRCKDKTSAVEDIVSELMVQSTIVKYFLEEHFEIEIFLKTKQKNEEESCVIYPNKAREKLIEIINWRCPDCYGLSQQVITNSVPTCPYPHGKKSLTRRMEIG